MSAVAPFRALRYDPSRVDLSRVIVPPYDVIEADEREALYARDPHSAIRLELTRRVEEEASTDYAEVRRSLEAWQRSRVLLRDARPALYGLSQSFDLPDGGRAVREGFFCLLRLEDYEKRVVHPHERTLSGPKADRLKLLRATRANLSPVFLLYEDREQALRREIAPEAGEELGVARDEAGAVHRLTRIEDPERVRAVQRFLTERPLVIADGHHRYETALAYRGEAGSAAAGWILAYLANAYAPGSLLLPIHRLVRKGPPPTAAAWSERLAAWRQESAPAADAEAVPALLARWLRPLADRHAFAADDGSARLRVFSRPRAPGDDLAVRVVHREVVAGVFGLDEAAVRDGAIGYAKSALRAAREVRAGRGAVALYLNALTPDDVFRVTEAGEVLPQKSTFFFPKLPTGLLFRPLDESP